MAQEAREEGAGRLSNVDIAATLLQTQTVTPTPEEEGEEQTEKESPTRGQDSDAEEQELETAEEAEDQSDDSDDEEEGDSDQRESDEGSEADEAEYLDIRDDDLMTLWVDDQEVEVSIGELKKTYSGEGAIEKRLQEATETRKQAHADATMLMERLAQDQAALETALDGLDDNLYQAVIPPPPAELKKSNPERYLQHKEAYDQDQERIAKAKQALEKALNDTKQQREERRQEYAKQAGQILVQEIPELGDPEKANPMFQRMAQTAKVYGYTDQEIQNALDPRMFMLVRDAMRYRELTDKTKGRDPEVAKQQQQQKKVRRLRSGNTQAKTRARQMDKQQREIRERAKKSGKVQDVAATLLQPARR